MTINQRYQALKGKVAARKEAFLASGSYNTPRKKPMISKMLGVGFFIALFAMGPYLLVCCRAYSATNQFIK